MIFYTYMWLRENGTPYYVGKGVRSRVYRKGGPPKDRIILEPHTSEEEAFAAEKFLIAYYGRIDLGTGCLRNRTAGGEGTTNMARRPAAWNKGSKGVVKAWNKGKQLSTEHRVAVSRTKKGCSPWNKGKVGVQRGSKHLLGTKNSKATRIKKSARMKKLWAENPNWRSK
jgi:hypothetical protein